MIPLTLKRIRTAPPPHDGSENRPGAATELTTFIKIEDFPDHGHLSLYRAVAPRTRRPGTSISSANTSRQGNKRLEDLLIFSYNPLVRNRGRFEKHYHRSRKRGMFHGEVLKPVATKRLRMVYVLMRSKVLYMA